MSDTPPSDQPSAAWRQPPVQRMLIYQALEDEASYRALYRGVAVWASRLMGACAPDQAHARAEEILQEAVAQALAKLVSAIVRPKRDWLPHVSNMRATIRLRDGRVIMSVRRR